MNELGIAVFRAKAARQAPIFVVAPAPPMSFYHQREQLIAQLRDENENALQKISQLQADYSAISEDLKKTQDELRIAKAEVGALRRRGGNEFRCPIVADIVAATAEAFNVTVADILSHRRHRYVAIPRHAAFFLAKVVTLRPLPVIGRALKRDHTTILNSVKKIGVLRMADHELDQKLTALENKLRGSVEA